MGKKDLSIFCLIVRVIVRSVVRVITYGHKNEECENKDTICLQFYIFKVHPKLLILYLGLSVTTFLSV